MATKIIMPQGGQDIAEGTVVSWLKKEGETVKKGEVVCEVETEKAVFEVQAPADGTLLKILAKEGEKVPIFAVIGVIGKPGEDISQLTGEDGKEKKGLDIAEIRKRIGKEVPGRADRIKASGRAKKVAAEKGIDLSEVQGTGPSGRIVEKDVLTHAKQFETRPEPAGPQVTGRQEMRGRRVPMSKMRHVIARRMQQSKQAIPHFYVTVSTDMTEAIRFRDAFNSQPETGEDGEISINDLVTKAVALARTGLAEQQQVLAAVQERAIAQAFHLPGHLDRKPRPLEVVPCLRGREPGLLHQARDPAFPASLAFQLRQLRQVLRVAQRFLNRTLRQTLEVFPEHRQP